MKSLAKGTSADHIFKLIKVMMNTQQQIFAEALKDTDAIEDIADKVQTDRTLFDEAAYKEGTFLNQGVYEKTEIFDDRSDVKNKADLTEDVISTTYTGHRLA